MRFLVRVGFNALLVASLALAGCADEPPSAATADGIDSPAVRDVAARPPVPEPQRPTPAPPPKPTPRAEAPEDFVIYLRAGESLSDVARRASLDTAEIRRASDLAANGETPPGTRLILRMTPSRAAEFMEMRLQAFGVRSVPHEIARGGKTPDGGGGAAEPARETVTVAVRRDEFVGLYAQWAGVPVREVLAANPELNPDRIAPGQRLVVPVPAGRRIEFEESREAWHERRRAPKDGAAGDAPPDAKPPGSPPPNLPPPDSRPPDSRPPDSRPPDSRPPDSRPPDSRPPDSRPPDSRPGGAKPLEVTTPPPEDPLCARSYRLRQGDIVWKLARRWGVTVKDIARCNPRKNLDRVTAGQVLQVPDAARTP